MKDSEKPKGTNTQEHELLKRQEKDPWQRPLLVLLGRLGELVQGGGKSGENIDADQRSQGKHGIG